MEQASLGSRKLWAARLAAAFYVAGGGLSLLTLPSAPADASPGVLVVVSVVAVGCGVVTWFLPWDRWPQRASLVLVPPGLLLIAAGNAYGGSDYFAYGVFYLLVFVWLGFAQPPGTSLVAAPFVALAYVLPLLELPASDRSQGLTSAALVIPMGILLGEGLARGTRRLIQTEADLQRERELRERRAKLDAMKESFLRAASHELRTPVTICRGHLEVLDPRAGSDEVAQTVELVIDELDRMGRLVGDITLLTRLSDRDALRRTTIEVAALLAEVAAKAKPLLDGRLTVAAPPAGRVTADRQRLNQALLDLLENVAVHAGDGVPVTLGAVREPDAWRFEVTDRGVGLGDLDPASLFQPFVHGPDSQGSGLGLALVRSISEAHGGEAGVRVGTGEHAGTTFWLRVPG